MTLRILLADDHQIIRDGLKALIAKDSRLEVAAEAENGRSAVQLANKVAPDIVIMDISMPDLNGIDATRQIRSAVPNAKVIALSMHSDRQFVEGMLKAGASGYLLKDCAFEELLTAVQAVAAGQIYLSPAIARTVVRQYLDRLGATEAVGAEPLSDREREVLQLIAEGHSTKAVAERLFISAKTVETHRRNIMEKLDLHSVAELTKYALRQGLTSIE